MCRLSEDSSTNTCTSAWPQINFTVFFKLTYITIIYNLKNSIPRVKIKTRYPHHDIHELESVAYIKISQIQSVKRLRTNHENRDTMGSIIHLLSALKSNETQNNTYLHKRSWQKIVICKEFCMTNYITYIHTYKTMLYQLVK